MVKPALLSLTNDSPNNSGGGPLNNQVTITLKSSGASRTAYCSFQVNRRDLLDLVEDYADENFFTHIPIKLRV